MVLQVPTRSLQVKLLSPHQRQAVVERMGDQAYSSLMTAKLYGGGGMYRHRRWSC